MGAGFADHFLAVLSVDLDRDGISHRARGNKKARLLAHHFGGSLLQPVDGRIFAVDVIADFGFGHGPAHGRRGSVTVSLRRSIMRR